MRDYGCLLGVLGPAAVLGYACFFFSHLGFYWGDKIIRGWLQTLCHEDDFLLSILNPKMADERLSSAFDRYLRKMMMLNTKKLLTARNNSRLSCMSGEETNRNVIELSQQQSHLEELLHDKSNIWPQNRSESWQKLRAKFVVRLHYLSSIFLFSNTYLILNFLVHSSVKILEVKGETPIKLSEVICILDEHLAVYLGLDKFVSSIVVLITNLRDKSHLLQIIRQRFEKLRIVLVHSRTINSENQQTADQMKTHCDREALEIYLSLRVFIDQMKPTIVLAGFVASQSFFFVFALLLVAMLFVKDANPDEVIFMLLIASVCAVAINFVFIFCASFEATCTRMIHGIWSLVANFIDAESTTINATELDDDQAAMKLQWHLMVPKFVTFRRVDYFESAEMKNSLINAGTVSLWRRFVEDMPALHKNFSCSIFNIIFLNYRELLSLNFWFVSIVLIFLTQTLH